VMRSCRKAIA